MKPISPKMKQVLDTIADAKNGEMSGWTVATWLNQRFAPEGVRESLRALTNRGLVAMRRTEERDFPDRLSAMCSIAKIVDS